MISFDLNTYCSLPFVGFDNRVKHVCCWTASEDKKNNFESFSQCVNSDTVQALQQDLLTGVKNPLCSTCWNHESVNVTSLRQTHLSRKNQQTIEDEIVSKQLKHLVIDSGNICNLSCRTCWPESSSGLIKEFVAKSKKFQIMPFQTKIRQVNLDQLRNENFDSIESISVLGGEPFQNLHHLDLLNHVIKLGRSKQCNLFYSTNGTVPLFHGIKNIFSQFKSVDISLSIDAVGDQFEYIRTNGDWVSTAQNIANLINLSKDYPNISLSGHPTISCLNVLYLEPLFQWYSNNSLPWITVFCNFPQEYSFSIFNNEQKEIIVKKLQKSKFDTRSIVKQIQQSKFNHGHLLTFYNQIEFTTEYKKLDASQFLPELTNLVKPPGNQNFTAK